MAMKTLVIASNICLGVICMLVAVSLLAEVKDNQKYRAESQQLQANLQATNTQVRALEEANAELANELNAKRSQLQELEARIAKAESAVTNKTADGAAAVPLRAYQVRTYLDDQYLGLGWMVPTKITTN